MSDDFQDVLDFLAANDGACLYWQLPNVKRVEAALLAGAVTMDDDDDSDLLLHPDAVKVSPGCYYMIKK